VGEDGVRDGSGRRWAEVNPLAYATLVGAESRERRARFALTAIAQPPERIHTFIALISGCRASSARNSAPCHWRRPPLVFTACPITAWQSSWYTTACIHRQALGSKSSLATTTRLWLMLQEASTRFCLRGLHARV